MWFTATSLHFILTPILKNQTNLRLCSRGSSRPFLWCFDIFLLFIVILIIFIKRLICIHHCGDNLQGIYNQKLLSLLCYEGSWLFEGYHHILRIMNTHWQGAVHWYGLDQNLPSGGKLLGVWLCNHQDTPATKHTYKTAAAKLYRAVFPEVAAQKPLHVRLRKTKAWNHLLAQVCFQAESLLTLGKVEGLSETRTALTFWPSASCPSTSTIWSSSFVLGSTHT